MKKIIAFLIVAITSLNLFSAEIRGVVVDVSDGDTITVLDEMDKARFKIRLHGIDAPEIKQDYGLESKLHLSSFVLNKFVVVRFKKIDRYGRIVGKVFQGPTEINLEMLMQGYAWHYKQFDKSQVYSGAEKYARIKRVGIWSTKNPIPPWNFRKK